MIEKIIVGAILGGLVGLAGGIFGGRVAGYYSPLAMILGPDGRLAISRAGARNGFRIGGFSGLLAGAATGAVGEFFQPLVLLLAAGAIFGTAAYFLVRGLDDVLIGLVEGAIGGAVLGVAGAYIGVLLLTELGRFA